MTWHIVCIAGPDDNFSPNIEPEDRIFTVPLAISGHPETFQSNIADRLAEYALEPSVGAYDFLNAATAAYLGDLKAPRTRTEGAYDNWTRQFALYLPVQDIMAWQEGGPIFERMLRFLTGDHWTVHIRQAPRTYVPKADKQPKTTRNISAEVAVLFSGGLDSFIGAIDQAVLHKEVTLIGHHGAGGGATSRAQRDTLATLRTEYSEDKVPFLQFWVSPAKVSPAKASPTKKRSGKVTTRSRSIMFLGLGVAVASGLRANSLIIPENGLISLNVPLTNSRLGSFSTRTTHPHLMALLRELLAALGIDLNISLPYRFKTKGEMVRDCSNQSLLSSGIASTISCSHPGAARFSGLNPNLHCGYCIPCLIRRAAIATAMTDPSQYVYEDLSQPLSKGRASDLRALKMALQRYGSETPKLKDVLVSGPLPGSDTELQQYLEVFRRGINEVRSLINRY